MRWPSDSSGRTRDRARPRPAGTTWPPWPAEPRRPAAPRRTDPATGESFTSVLKPLGQSYSSKSIDLNTDQLTAVQLEPATEADVAATVKVMGGEDWALWMKALADEDLLAEGCHSVAYSYLGAELT